MRRTRKYAKHIGVLAFCAAISRAAVAAPAPADWVFNSFPTANKPIYEVAAFGDTIFMVVNFYGGFYRSTDHGRNWQLQDTSLSNRFYHVKAFGAEVFLFGDVGILRSRDRGPPGFPPRQAWER